VAYQKIDQAQFKPRATLGLLYLFGLFFLFCFLLAAPTFWHVLQTTEPGPEQQQIAEQAVKKAMSLTRLGIALGLAGLVTLIGGRFRLLPGTRR
jgi:hypothetical protein